MIPRTRLRASCIPDALLPAARHGLVYSGHYILAICRSPNPLLPYCLRLLCALCILGQWARNPLLLPSSHLWTTFTQATKSSDVDWGSQ